MELYGVRIPTIISENVAVRCAGCGGIIRGTPWRISILDIVSTEKPPSWAEQTTLNPGPFEFHGDPAHVLSWMAQRGMLFCRRSQIREMMRPVWLPPGTEGGSRRLGLCDGIHRDDHEFVEPPVEASTAASLATEARPSPEQAERHEARAVEPRLPAGEPAAPPDADETTATPADSSGPAPRSR